MKTGRWNGKLAAMLCVLLAGCAVSPGQEVPSASQSLPDIQPEEKELFLPEAGSDTLFALLVDDWGTLRFSRQEYPDEDRFFQSQGFAPEDAVRRELPDGELLFCWDAQTGRGCGIRRTDSGAAGFAFAELLPGEGEQWERWKADGTAQPESLASAEGIDGYTESVERDDAGRLIRYESRGILSDYGGTESESICTLQLVYDEAGILRERHFSGTMRLYASNDALWDSFYDEAGRLIYEHGYLTHGSQEYHYFYEQEGTVPVSILYLDNDCGTYIPQFAAV